MQANKRNTSVALTLFFMLAAWATMSLSLTACGHGPSVSDTRRLEALQRIDDSIVALSPTVRSDIERGMAEASDSLSYYEYCVRLMRWYSFSEHPDSINSLYPAIVRFARSQPPSPRVNALLAFAYVSRANVYHFFHQRNDEVIRLHTEAYRLLLESDQQNRLPMLCANLADAYYAEDDMPTAAQWYRRALFLVDSLRLPKSENTTLYMGLGQIYLMLNDYDKAEEYYRQTEDLYSTMTPNMQSYFLNNYGNLYYYQHDYHRALEKFLRLERHLEARGLQDHFDMYLCHLNMADLYLNLDSLQQATRCLEPVEHYFRDKGDGVALYYCTTIRLGIAVRQGRTDRVRTLLAGEKPCEGVPANMKGVRNAYLRDYYRQTGDHRRAYDLLAADIARTDSLEHNRQNMRSADIMARFSQDTLQLHRQLDIERRDAALQRANTLTIGIVCVVLVLVLLFTLWTLNVRKRFAQNQVRVMQLKLDNVRNRISPHFIFNVLNNKIVHSSAQDAAELQDLARLIRANLDMSCMASMTLDRELDFVRRYVDVERFMVGDDFSFTVNVPEGFDLSQVAIPSMFLQILVENAMVHGLRGWEGRKTLCIDVSRADSATTVSVTDNGPGFDARNGATRKRTGLGIITQTVALVNERNKRKMRFNLENITDSDGHVLGCRATLLLPDHTKYLE